MNENDLVTRYVSQLALEMIRNRTLSRTLRRSEMAESAGCAFIDVANRLKRMCDLEQREYDLPADGRFTVTAQGKDVTFWVRFHDAEADPALEITLVPDVQPG